MAASKRKEEEKGGNNNNSEVGGSGCPVLLNNTNKENNASTNYSCSSFSGSSSSWNPLGWFRSSSSSPFSSSSSFKVSDDDKTVSTSSSSSTTMEIPDGAATGVQGVVGCPVKYRNTQPIPLRNNKKAKGCDSTNLPPSIEEAARHAQSPAPGQTVPLSTRRVISSIPRGGSDDYHNVSQGTNTFSELANNKKQQTATTTTTTTTTTNLNIPHHQPTSAPNNKWVYPSEQQFYNAILRKGYTIQDESVIPNIVQIHNAVNERAWSEIIRWEQTLHGLKHSPTMTRTKDNHHDKEENNSDETRLVQPKLVKFYGRPQDLSPKAFINTYLLWYTKPFDRHDWYVDRYGDGTKIQRYVIDFYSGNDGSNPQEQQQQEQEQEQAIGNLTPTNTHYRPPAMYLDVRPALDDFDSLFDRMRMFVRDAFPGIFDVFTANTNVTKHEYTAAGTATAGTATAGTAAAAATTTPDASSTRTTASAATTTTTTPSASKNST